jgi:hypothetical protein
LIEGGFALWVGHRGYDYASHQSKGSYETISEIPLCKGRSRMAEALCPDWIEITQNQVPRSFWTAFENEELRDERSWSAIRQFSVNCEKRLVVESRIRKERNLPEKEPIVLSERVADDTVDSLDSLLNKRMVANLLSDQGR